MWTLGFLSRLFGRKKEAAGTVPTGVKMKPGTDIVQTPLRCPACSRQVAKFTPDKGIARCQCGKQFAIIDFEVKPLPKDMTLDGT